MTLHIETRLARVGLGRDPASGAVSCPIHPSATFAHPGLGQTTGFDYARTGNPTRAALESALAELEGGAGAFCFASGMAALTTFFHLFRSGDHLVVSDDLYGGTYRALEEVFRPLGVTASYVDLTDPAALAAAWRPETRAVLVETPTNPLLKVVDLAALARETRRRGILLAVDNTFLTPYLQRPLALGADLVVHSGTKYLGGHNDLLAGVLVAREAHLAARISFLQNTTGAVLGAQDSWLLLRSLKTLAVRVARQVATAQAVAEFLSQDPAVPRVYYPGLPDHPGHRVLRGQASGFGGVVSFRLPSAAGLDTFLASLELITFAESLGGVESLVTVPSRQTHCDLPAQTRVALGITDDLVRLSLGLEAAADLMADLAQALRRARS